MNTVRINGALPTLNEYIKIERGNKYASAKLKKQYTELVMMQCLGKRAFTNKVNIAFEWHTTRKADNDNLVFAKKFILDGLVKAGMLKNDNMKYVGNFTDTIIKDSKDYCILTFEEVT